MQNQIIQRLLETKKKMKPFSSRAIQKTNKNLYQRTQELLTKKSGNLKGKRFLLNNIIRKLQSYLNTQSQKNGNGNQSIFKSSESLKNKAQRSNVISVEETLASVKCQKHVNIHADANPQSRRMPMTMILLSICPAMMIF